MTVEHRPRTRELTLWQALKAATSSISDDFVRFVAGNIIWLAIVAGAVLAGNLVFAAHAALALLVPVSYGLCRMAAGATRDRPARLAQLREGSVLRGWAGFGLGCAQLLLIGLAATNIAVAVQAPSLLLVLSAIISGYAGLFVTATVFVIWPLLLDPDGERAIVPTLRLGLTVIAARPGRILALVIVEACLIAVGVQALLAALILPAFGLLLASWVVLPLADGLGFEAAVQPPAELSPPSRVADHDQGTRVDEERSVRHVVDPRRHRRLRRGTTRNSDVGNHRAP